MKTSELLEPFKFFRANAGYCDPPGKAACALALARAEEWARENDLTLIWHMEDEFRQGELPSPCECCFAIDPSGYVLASLGGITNATDDYRRVIQAQLALEAQTASAALAIA